MYFVAIDLGATYIKSCIIDENFQIQNIQRVPFPAFDNVIPYHRTVTFSKIVDGVRTVLNAQLANISDCQGILFSNQMHGLVLFDKTGQAVTPFISWQDKRSAVSLSDSSSSPIEILRGVNRDFIWHQETGEYLRIGFPVTQLFSMKLAGERLEGLIPLDLGNAVAHSLSRSAKPLIDTTNAAAFGCYDIKRHTWHTNLLSKLGLSDLAWPEIVEPGVCSGSLDDNNKTNVYVSIGDQQISLLGAGLAETDTISVNIATGSQVSVLSKQFLRGDFQTRPYFFRNYLKTITHIPAGRSLNALLKLFTEVSSDISFDEAWSKVEAKIVNIKSSNLNVDLSFFSSAFGERGSINNISEEDLNVGAVMYAAFANIADNHFKGFQNLNSSKLKYKEIIGSGGVLKKSKTIQKLLIEKFQVPLNLSSGLEDALIGHSFMARDISKD
jgi:sugar (pentulose or hexulose) kinase